jgi:hypothetical protein
MIEKTQHGFSVEVESEKYIINLTIKEKNRGVLVEGYLGEIRTLGIIDDAVLVIEAEHGTLRLDLTPDELSNIVRKKQP